MPEDQTKAAAPADASAGQDEQVEREREQAEREKAEQERQANLKVKLEQFGSLFEQAERRRTGEVIQLGKLAHDCVLEYFGPETAPATRKRLRASAVDDLHLLMKRVGSETRPDVNRYIAVYHVARLFDGEDMEAATMQPLGVLRAMTPLIARDAATEEWSIKPDHCDKAKKLWRKIVGKGMVARDVGDSVARILDPSKASEPQQAGNADGDTKAGTKADNTKAEPNRATSADHTPGDCAAHARKVLDSAGKDRLASYRMLGHTIDSDALTSLLVGLSQSVTQDRERVALWKRLAIVFAGETRKLRSAGILEAEKPAEQQPEKAAA